MKREELNIFNNHPKRRNILPQNIRIGAEYKLIEKVPYIDSTIYRRRYLFGQIGDVVIVTNNYVDQECGVLFVVFECKDSCAGISMPLGMFGYYFRPIKKNNNGIQDIS